jgi:hypothetical protein
MSPDCHWMKSLARRCHLSLWCRCARLASEPTRPTPTFPPAAKMVSAVRIRHELAQAEMDLARLR